MNKITGLVLARMYAITLIKFTKWIKYYNRNSNNVVWILPCFSISNFYNYLLKSNTLFHDIALISSIVDRGMSFRVLFGDGSFNEGDNVLFTISDFFTVRNDIDYSHKLITRISRLTDNGCKTFPSLAEVKLWENKAWMHEEFARLKIIHPYTVIVNDKNDEANLKFPFLIKEVHSCGSKGIFQIANRSEFNSYWSNKADDDSVLYQQLLNMRKDLRVILANGKIISHYWRLNDSDFWRPTSTAHGSRVDFDFFPEQWRELITCEFRKLNCATGAFDIAWQDDNLDNLPFILEFSPFYMPNPAPPSSFKFRPYNEYKRSIFCKSPYYKKYVDMIVELKAETLIHYFPITTTANIS